MRWTLVTETYPPEVNGVAMTLQRLASAIAAQGHTVSIVRPRQAADRAAMTAGKEAADGGTTKATADESATKAAGKEAATTADGTAAIDSAKMCAWQPPAIHTDFVLGLPIPGYSGLLLGRMAKSKLVKLWTAQRPDVVHIATEGPLGFSALFAARKLGIPVVSTFHTNFHRYGEHYRLGFFKRPAMAYLRWFHNRTLATFAPSDDVLAQLQRQGVERLRLMGRGVDMGLFGPHRRSEALRQRWGVSPQADVRREPIVLYVGRVAAEKNLPFAIVAFERLRERLPKAQMVIVGDGPLRKRLEQAYPHIHFAGMCHGENLAEHYASADLFFFASVTETFGNVITEAMASALVVLAYDYAAAARYIENGVSGFTAAFNDNQALLAAVDRLVAASDQWRKVGDAAAAAVADLSWDGIAQTYLRETQAIIAQQTTAGQSESSA